MAWGPTRGFAGPGSRQQLLSRTFSGLAAGLLLLDPHGRITAANPRAEELLGRRATAMIGADVHELLHRGPDGERIPRSRCVLQAVAEHGRPAWGESDTFLTADGRALPVRWSAAPVVHGDRTVGLAVLFADVAGSSAPVGTEAARVDLLEDLAERLTLVGVITEVLSETLDVEEAVDRLGPLLVPQLSDWVAVDLRTPEGEVRRVAVLGPQGRDSALEAWRGPLPAPMAVSRSALVRVLRGGQPVLLGPREMSEPPDTPLAAVQAGFLRAMGAASAAVVPLTSAREVTGAITAVRTAADRPFTRRELALLADIGHRAGVAIDNARLFGEQRDIATAMQRHLLTELPQSRDLQLAARYRPAPAGSRVGGDWYDAFLLRDGTTALVIGDVIGHDLQAAARMAQLRNILRALAWDRHEGPAAIVARLDDAMAGLTDVPMATMVLAYVVGPAGGPWQLRWTSAGHPPPLLLPAAGSTVHGGARYLEAGQGIVLGAGGGRGRPDGQEDLPAGSTLLLFTDGLVEVPGTDLGAGLESLRRYAAGLTRCPLEQFCDRILRAIPPGGADDTALLAVRVPD
ncbi:SpoIIE family protein phosphatase [Kitasatospora sp. DSM 101779]|uniref:SpoIIE family protein phosphatase n=1 Tax=Kitasatospora sp. DSM 101779 TaxID=2853165 RepID=UPI0021D7F710|nr:SpoIIE family protein phosphatase [Kitasatospora sp. DSM 101779]MCU7820986.1 SpoIIE family protein phosphatase [Kitasatospora sp. DSM 101779]